jgi:hypothetical protein
LWASGDGHAKDELARDMLGGTAQPEVVVKEKPNAGCLDPLLQEKPFVVFDAMLAK